MAQTFSGYLIPTPKSGVAIGRIPFDAPWDWLAAGWRDLWSVPRISLGYGTVFALLAGALAFGLTQIGWLSLMLAMGGGFLLIGPLVAVGLYEASRRLERGEPVGVRDVVMAGPNAPGQVAFFGVILAFVFFVWLELAFLLFMLFMGTRGLPPVSEFVPTLLFTPHGLGLLVVGTIVGGILAMIVYAISAISPHRCCDGDVGEPRGSGRQPEADGAVGRPHRRVHGARHRNAVRRADHCISFDRACDLARLPQPRDRFRSLIAGQTDGIIPPRPVRMLSTTVVLPLLAVE